MKKIFVFDVPDELAKKINPDSIMYPLITALRIDKKIAENIIVAEMAFEREKQPKDGELVICKYKDAPEVKIVWYESKFESPIRPGTTICGDIFKSVEWWISINNIV